MIKKILGYIFYIISFSGFVATLLTVRKTVSMVISQMSYGKNFHLSYEMLGFIILWVIVTGVTFFAARKLNPMSWQKLLLSFVVFTMVVLVLYFVVVPLIWLPVQNCVSC